MTMRILFAASVSGERKFSFFAFFLFSFFCQALLFAKPICPERLQMIAEGRFKQIFLEPDQSDRVFVLLIDHLAETAGRFVQDERELKIQILDHLSPLQAAGIPAPKVFGLVEIPGKGPAVEMERLYATLQDVIDSRLQKNGKSRALYEELKTFGPQFYEEWKQIVRKFQDSGMFPDDLQAGPSQIGIRKLGPGEFRLVVLDPVIGRYRASIEEYLEGRSPSPEEYQFLWGLSVFESEKSPMKDWADGRSH